MKGESKIALYIKIRVDFIRYSETIIRCGTYRWMFRRDSDRRQSGEDTLPISRTEKRTTATTTPAHTRITDNISLPYTVLPVSPRSRAFSHRASVLCKKVRYQFSVYVRDYMRYRYMYSIYTH